MDIKRKLIFCGGDRRLLECAALFARDGYDCRAWKSSAGDCKGVTKISDLRENCGGASALILPVPAFTLGGKLNCQTNERCSIDSEYIFSSLDPGTVIFGGRVGEMIHRVAAEYNHKITDYGEREEFNVFNAALTAEAAIYTAMKHMSSSVCNSHFTVLGYGRIGRALTLRLRALGAHVCVAARSEAARANAECDGASVMSVTEFLSSPGYFDVCFNTVPCHIIDDECAYLSDGLFIDLASVPGGFTDEARTVLGERLIIALSLPGKYCPFSAGEVIYKTVKGILKQKEAMK